MLSLDEVPLEIGGREDVMSLGISILRDFLVFWRFIVLPDIKGTWMSQYGLQIRSRGYNFFLYKLKGILAGFS